MNLSEVVRRARARRENVVLSINKCLADFSAKELLGTQDQRTGVMFANLGGLVDVLAIVVCKTLYYTGRREPSVDEGIEIARRFMRLLKTILKEHGLEVNDGDN